MVPASGGGMTIVINNSVNVTNNIYTNNTANNVVMGALAQVKTVEILGLVLGRR
jgi:hypothetical protein